MACWQPVHYGKQLNLLFMVSNFWVDIVKKCSGTCFQVKVLDIECVLNGENIKHRLTFLLSYSIQGLQITTAGFPAGPFWGGDSPPPPKKKISYSPPKFVLTLFLITLSAPTPRLLPPPPSPSTPPPPKGEILQETLNRVWNVRYRIAIYNVKLQPVDAFLPLCCAKCDLRIKIPCPMH